MLGLETALYVVSEVLVRPGLLDWAAVARVMSTRSGPHRSARRARDGRSSAGSPANLTLVDPDREVTVDAAASRSRSRNNPWHGRTFRGAVHTTIHRGTCHPRAPEQTVRRELTSRPGNRTTQTPLTVPAARAARLREPALLVLEDGRRFRGSSYGAVGETVGEAVFSTGMSGYQETLTDPSYHRQVIVMTAPHVGNTGVNDEDDESHRHLGGRLRRARPRDPVVELAGYARPRGRAASTRASSASARSTPGL